MNQLKSCPEIYLPRTALAVLLVALLTAYGLVAKHRHEEKT